MFFKVSWFSFYQTQTQGELDAQNKAIIKIETLIIKILTNFLVVELLTLFYSVDMYIVHMVYIISPGSCSIHSLSFFAAVNNRLIYNVLLDL